MPETNSQDSVKPVSILTNRNNSNVSISSATSDEKQAGEVKDRCVLPAGNPRYEVGSIKGTGARIAAGSGHRHGPALQVVTKIPAESESGGAQEHRGDTEAGNGALRTPLTATSVSFTVPGHREKVMSHRRSISTRPSSTKATTPTTAVTATSSVQFMHDSSGGITPVLSNSTIDDTLLKPSSSRQTTVHIPGDFIPFDAIHSTREEKTGTPEATAVTSNSAVHENAVRSLNGSPRQTADRGSVIDQVSKKNLNKKLISEEEPHIPFGELFHNEDDNKIHILIGATGSVATIKVPMIIDKLFKIYGEDKVSIQLVLTKHAEHFLKGAKINKEVKIWRNEDEWYGFKRMGDPVLHTELRKWADIFVIAPISANTLAKLANGICDNLLTCLIRSWKSNVPVIIAPAMNTFMYTHPVTKKHILMLQEDYPYVEILKPVEKVLICGDIGMGGMREWVEIVERITKKLKLIRGNSKSLETEEEDKDDDDEDDDDDDYEDDDEDDEDDDEDDEDDDDDDDDDDDIVEEDATESSSTVSNQIV